MDARNHDPPLQLEDHYSFEPKYGYGPGARPAMGFAEISETLRRGWRFPLYGFLIGLALAAAYVVAVQVPYKSSARILIDRSVNRYLQTNKISDQPTFDESEIASQVYVLSSDSVIVPVIRSLKLAHDSEFVGHSNVGGVTILDQFAKLIEIFKKAVGANTDTKTESDLRFERRAVEAVLKRLTVNREDVANVINVTFESQDPNKAANIANAIADAYISSTLEGKLRAYFARVESEGFPTVCQ